MPDHTDRTLAQAAIAKLRAGETPTAREAQALRRVEKEQEETKRWAFYRSVPAKHYKEMSGRPARVLIDQAQRWGIPCSGKVIDMTAVVKWFHDFIANYTHRAAEEEGGGGGGGGGSKHLERYRGALADEKEMEVAEVRGELVPLIEVKQLVGESAARLVRVLGIVENTVAMEFSLWLVDPKVQQMPADERTRMVRDYVAQICHEVREREAMDVRMLIDQLRQEEDAAAATQTPTSESETDGATTPTTPTLDASAAPHPCDRPSDADDDIRSTP